MKRNLLIIFLFVFFVSGVYAEFHWSAWGRGVFAPIAFSGEDSSVSAATYNTETIPRVGFSLKGISNTGNIGFNADFFWGGGIPGVGDNGNVRIAKNRICFHLYGGI